MIQPACLIENNSQFLNMVEDLKQNTTLGVDTESNSLFVYHEKVCLIQFSTPERDYLLDTMKVKNISPLHEIFESHDIEKIFHAAEYDLMCLKRDYGFKFNNIFDTMHAAKILDMPAIGLQSLLSTFFGIMVEKKYQTANWGFRPLSPEMQKYAQLDTHYLLRLKKILLSKLIEDNKWDFAREDFLLLANTKPFENHKYLPFYKMLKGTKFSPLTEAILYELYLFRENLAEKLDRPPFKILRNQVILDIVKIMPQTRNELAQIKGIPKMVLNKNAQNILDILKISHPSESTYSRKPYPKIDPFTLEKNKALKDWRKNKGRELSMESDIILPREYISQISESRLESKDVLKTIMRNIPHRFQLFGEEIYSLIKGINQP